VKISEILKALGDIVVDARMNGEMDITDIETHSSNIREGCVFICRKGYKFDSHDIAEEVVDLGAKLLIVERDLKDIGVPVIKVVDSRLAEAILASEFYGHPYKYLLTFAITGTNGKTTAVHMIHHILKSMGKKGSLIGTVMNDVLGEISYHENTTPSALEIVRAMKKTKDGEGEYFVLEVSSHAISLKRIEGLKFDSVGLTNITRDHLDFHRDFDDYMKTKLRIFEFLKDTGVGVINEEYADMVKKRIRKVTYGFKKSSTYSLEDVNMTREGISFKVRTPEGLKEVRLRILGEYNALNAVMVIAILHQTGFDIDEIIYHMETFPGVDGRFEFIEEASKLGIDVVVDFAHTPDALEKVLKTARKLAKGRVIIVFGAGGNSDKGKRPMMAKIASELADVMIVTTDDPRGEDPKEIFDDLVKGIIPGTPYLVLPDRREAIETAITLANRGDMVIVAGRGHEHFQVFSDDKKIPFKDRDVILEIIQEKIRRKGK